jgi:hypothetical protein
VKCIEWEIASAGLVISSGAASQGWAYWRHSKAVDMERRLVRRFCWWCDLCVLSHRRAMLLELRGWSAQGEALGTEKAEDARWFTT